MNTTHSGNVNTTHSGIEITYKEEDNRWYFELRGRSRNAESLTKAKEAIDKEPSEKRKQVFPRFDAYRINSWGWDLVSVTSVADAGYRSGEYFWVNSKKRGREKESALSLVPVNDQNSITMKEINAIEEQIASLEEVKSKRFERLQCATVPKELA